MVKRTMKQCLDLQICFNMDKKPPDMESKLLIKFYKSPDLKRTRFANLLNRPCKLAKIQTRSATSPLC